MNKFQTLYFKLIPFFSAIFLIYSGYQLYASLIAGNFERMKIFIFVTLLFAVSFVASLILIFKKN